MLTATVALIAFSVGFVFGCFWAGRERVGSDQR